MAVTSSTDLVTGLDAPWGLAFQSDGTALVTLRDAAQVLLITPATPTAPNPTPNPTPLTGPGAAELAATTTPGGEAGLLGVAVAPAGGPHAGEVYLYRTTAGGNEVVRARLDGTVLAGLTTVVDGIPRAGNHDGGRLAFGPDGYLYVTTGDAGDPPAAQDPASPAGKILRLTADGAPAPGNPSAGSPVWSLGHRNVQGIGWAPDGRLFAAEFGQNTFDELNLITPGANYGWPAVEGTGGTEAGFADPLATWPTSDASPSGLAVTAEGVYLAGLRGERLWRVPLTADGVGRPQELLAGELGRLRAVVVAPDGSLWIVTNNTDGRGDPRPGDDRIVRVTVG
ncbi:PQQ-dependent sugar dehydrogenase [Pengzhenrongella sicca]|uniref:PQQ-dependent sugar dehydrogenase n=1 Tax=Pengzhenrongella sicca TaxID=2819238 RepID=UPI0029C9C9B4|nr:PQQ-dependent sugar dehydrogenase [Pengzhenrongella sicca]